ncbi:hypothetical protein NKG94_10785 [Micromonospora sp. M12]
MCSSCCCSARWAYSWCAAVNPRRRLRPVRPARPDRRRTGAWLIHLVAGPAGTPGPGRPETTATGPGAPPRSTERPHHPVAPSQKGDRHERSLHLGSPGSIAGASAATLLATNVIGGLIGPSGDKLRKWIAIAIALLLSYGTAAFADDAGGESGSSRSSTRSSSSPPRSASTSSRPATGRRRRHRSPAVASPESSVPGSEGCRHDLRSSQCGVQVGFGALLGFLAGGPIGLLIGAVVGLVVGAVFGWSVVSAGCTPRTPAASSSSSSTTPGVCSTLSSAPST